LGIVRIFGSLGARARELDEGVDTVFGNLPSA